MSYVFAEYLFTPARKVLHFADFHETHQPSTVLTMYLLHGMSCNRTYKQKMWTEIHLIPPKLKYDFYRADKHETHKP
jgi:hypothetical protein